MFECQIEGLDSRASSDSEGEVWMDYLLWLGMDSVGPKGVAPGPKKKNKRCTFWRIHPTVEVTCRSNFDVETPLWLGDGKNANLPSIWSFLKRRWSGSTCGCDTTGCERISRSLCDQQVVIAAQQKLNCFEEVAHVFVMAVWE